MQNHNAIGHLTLEPSRIQKACSSRSDPRRGEYRLNKSLISAGDLFLCDSRKTEDKVRKPNPNLPI